MLSNDSKIFSADLQQIGKTPHNTTEALTRALRTVSDSVSGGFDISYLTYDLLKELNQNYVPFPNNLLLQTELKLNETYWCISDKGFLIFIQYILEHDDQVKLGLYEVFDKFAPNETRIATQKQCELYGIDLVWESSTNAYSLTINGKKYVSTYHEEYHKLQNLEFKRSLDHSEAAYNHLEYLYQETKKGFTTWLNNSQAHSVDNELVGNVEYVYGKRYDMLLKDGSHSIFA
jgi:hypothetical protein